MNILYLHGLESKLGNCKREILENYGKVFAPNIDYKGNPNVIQNLYDAYKNQDINIIIGSSFGGFAGYYLAERLGVSALLFNPALPYRSSEQRIPMEIPIKESPILRVVLGLQDTIVKASDNLIFLSENLNIKTTYSFIVKNNLAHQISINHFDDETTSFFDLFCC